MISKLDLAYKKTKSFDFPFQLKYKEVLNIKINNKLENFKVSK